MSPKVEAILRGKVGKPVNQRLDIRADAARPLTQISGINNNVHECAGVRDIALSR